MNKITAKAYATFIFCRLFLGVSLVGMLITACVAPQPILPAFESTTQATFVEVNSGTLVSKIYQQFKKGELVIEIASVERALPTDIADGQIGKYFRLGPIYFALVLHQSMNVPLNLPEGYVISFTGILVSDDSVSWKKFLEIKDKGSTDKNNPYYLWSDEGALFLSIVDQNGAGSGEGIMKLEKLSAQGEWVLADCFYFGGSYRGPSLDGDYFAFSRSLEKQKEQPEEFCQNAELVTPE